MDPFERLADAYHARASSSDRSRLGVLMDIARIRDTRVVPFLLRVLADHDESADVRLHVVKRLRNRNGFIAQTDRLLVAEALGEVLVDDTNEQLRLQAALSLGDFADVEGVLSRLTAVALASDESIDVRYAAFTSVERAGPTPESIAHVWEITRDDALGDAARGVLSMWRVTLP
jgi:hypothetical protein